MEADAERSLTRRCRETDQIGGNPYAAFLIAGVETAARESPRAWSLGSDRRRGAPLYDFARTIPGGPARRVPVRALEPA